MHPLQTAVALANVFIIAQMYTDLLRTNLCWLQWSCPSARWSGAPCRTPRTSGEGRSRPCSEVPVPRTSGIWGTSESISTNINIHMSYNKAWEDPRCTKGHRNHVTCWHSSTSLFNIAWGMLMSSIGRLSTIAIMMILLLFYFTGLSLTQSG